MENLEDKVEDCEGGAVTISIGGSELKFEHVDDKENSPLDKTQELYRMRRLIRPLMDLLGREPTSEAERYVCCSEGEFDRIVKEDSYSNILTKLRELHTDINKEVFLKKEAGIKLWEEVQTLWDDVNKHEELELAYSVADFSILKSLEDIKSRILFKQGDKLKRIEQYIMDLRHEISDIWAECMISEEEKNEFKEFTSTDFTEHLLCTHKEELKRWQVYYKKNQEILQKISKREAMWKTLKELEAKADDPNRFVNRGGTLLKDQNMHNHIMKTLPKLESELIDLGEKFSEEHGRKIKILGREIPDIIEEEWNHFKTQKQKKKFARTNTSTNFSSTNLITPSAKPTVPLKARKSVAPSLNNSIIPGSMRAGEKRPASRVFLQSTPSNLSRRKIGSSVDSGLCDVTKK